MQRARLGLFLQRFGGLQGEGLTLPQGGKDDGIVVVLVLFGDNKRMVVGYLFIVHAAAVERCPSESGGTGGESGVLLQKGDARGYFVENIVGYVTGAGTGIAQHFVLFVERLRKCEGLVRRKAEFAVRLFLQGGQVVEKRRLLIHFSALHFAHRNRSLPRLRH